MHMGLRKLLVEEALQIYNQLPKVANKINEKNKKINLIRQNMQKSRDISKK
jgi:hypothetical protein